VSGAPELRASPDSAVEFLREITPPDGFGNVTAIDAYTGKCTGAGFHRNSLEATRAFIAANIERNLYWTVNGPGRQVDKKPDKSDIVEMRYAHLDKDDPSEAALVQICTASPPPTLVIFSGGGYGAFWRLAEPVKVNGNLDALETVNKRLIEIFGAGKGTQNIDRLMRLPFTVNHLNEKKRRDGRQPAETYVVEHHPERVYTLEELAAITCDDDGQPQLTAPMQEAGSHSDSPGDRSRDLLKKVAADVRAGKSDQDIITAHRGHPHARDQADPDRAVRRCIERARDDARRARPSQGTQTDDERTAGTDASAAAFPLIWFSGLNDYVPPEQIVKGLLTAGSLFVVYGESNSGKTFFILDLTLAVAQGAPWRDRRTRRGLVIYVAGEGAASVRARIKAYRIAHPEVSGALAFAIVPQAINFLDAASIARLIVTIRAAESEYGEEATILIVDTFARALPGADENSAQDVGSAVAWADQIRAQTGIAVGFVHHAGKDPTKGARGSSALRAATDTEILIEGTSGTRTVTVTKQRDLEPGTPMVFELQTVEIGADPETGEPITSCVVKHLGGAVVADTPAFELRGRAQRQLLKVLRDKSKSDPGRIWTLTELRQIGKDAGFVKSTAWSAVDALAASPYLRSIGGGYLFTDGKPQS
jgi:hypothetical protein